MLSLLFLSCAINALEQTNTAEIRGWRAGRLRRRAPRGDSYLSSSRERYLSFFAKTRGCFAFFLKMHTAFR